MEQYKLDRDIRALCVKANSFPDGITDAFDRLGKLLGPSGAGRQYYGISHKNDKGEIMYFAAAEERFADEASRLGCEVFVIKRGTYISIYITGFRSNIAAIGNAFQELLSDPRIDPQGACVEIYDGMDNVRCMVRLDPSSL